MAAGLDSLSSVEFRNSLEARLGLALPSTLVFDYPTVAAIAQLVASQQQAAGAPAAVAAPAPAAPSPAAAAAHSAAIRAEVSATVRGILGADVAANEPLMSAGLDSLSSVEFRNSLEAKLGVELPSTLVFDYPSVDAITLLVASKLLPLAGVAAPGGGAAPQPVDELALLTAEVGDAVRGVLRLTLSEHEPLAEAGVDAAGGAKLLRALGARLGAVLPPDLLQRCPTIAALAAFLASTPLEAATAADSSAFDQPTAGELVIPASGGLFAAGGAAQAATVAVVRMSARLPCGVLERGAYGARDACGPIAGARWEADRQTWLTGGAAVRFAGLLQVSQHRFALFFVTSDLNKTSNIHASAASPCSNC